MYEKVSLGRRVEEGKMAGVGETERRSCGTVSK